VLALGFILSASSGLWFAQCEDQFRRGRRDPGTDSTIEKDMPRTACQAVWQRIGSHLVDEPRAVCEHSEQCAADFRLGSQACPGEG